jgi:hypothetical protein
MFRSDTFKLSAKFMTAITAVVTVAAAVQAPASAVTIVRHPSVANVRPVTRHSAQSLVATTASTVYVADTANNVISVFNAAPAIPGVTTPMNVRPIRTIPTGNTPIGITVDSNGNLYVADFIDNNVLEYAPGSSTPFRTLTAGLDGPLDVKVSLTGPVYVANAFGTGNSNNSSVVIYAPNSSTPLATWQSPVANAPLTAIALQSPDYAPGGDAYVAYSSPAGGGGILWCPVGSASCFDTGIVTSGLNESLTFQYNTFPLTLLVPDARNSVVDVYHLRHGRTPAAVFSVAAPTGLAFDPGFNNFFVASNTVRGPGSVNEYSYLGGALSATFAPAPTTRQPRLAGVAVYPSAMY